MGTTQHWAVQANIQLGRSAPNKESYSETSSYCTYIQYIRTSAVQWKPEILTWRPPVFLEHGIELHVLLVCPQTLYLNRRDRLQPWVYTSILVCNHDYQCMFCVATMITSVHGCNHEQQCSVLQPWVPMLCISNTRPTNLSVQEYLLNFPVMNSIAIPNIWGSSGYLTSENTSHSGLRVTTLYVPLSLSSTQLSLRQRILDTGSWGFRRITMWLSCI